MKQWRAFGWMLLGSGWLIIALFVVQYVASPPSGRTAFANGLAKLLDPSERVWDFSQIFEQPKFRRPLYFLPGSFFPGNQRDDAFRSIDYSHELTAFREPSLGDTDSPDGLRFMYGRSFNTKVVVRISRETNGAWTLVSKRREWQSNSAYNDPNLLSWVNVERTAMVPDSEMKRWWDELANCGFWDRWTTKRDYLDGAQWVLEARRDGHHHVLDEWSPTSGAFRDFCVRLLHAGHVDQGPLY